MDVHNIFGSACLSFLLFGAKLVRAIGAFGPAGCVEMCGNTRWREICTALAGRYLEHSLQKKILVLIWAEPRSAPWSLSIRVLFFFFFFFLDSFGFFGAHIYFTFFVFFYFRFFLIFKHFLTFFDISPDFSRVLDIF